MQNHIVIGAGNLGQDLKIALESRGHNVLLVSSSTGWDWPRNSILDMHVLNKYEIDLHTVWCAIGSGSVKEAKDNFSRSMAINVGLPMELMRIFPDHIKLVFFTSDYADTSVDYLRSQYALTKHTLEQAVRLARRPNVRLYRVSSLYGTHKPLKTFPGKIIRAAKDLGPRETMTVPKNPCYPTPTDWLAKEVVTHMEKVWVSSSPVIVYPDGRPASSAEWAGTILGHHRVVQGDFDPERPVNGIQGKNECDPYYPIPWQHLWAHRAGSMNQAIHEALK